MSKLKFNFLEWDSSFFSLVIFKLEEVEEIMDNFYEEIEKFVIDNNVDLIYYESDYLIDEMQFKKTILNCNLVDEKTTFKKTCTFRKLDSDLIKKVSEINIEKYYDKIIDLAIQSAEYSRFKVDKRFKAQDYINLYREWILKSVNKKNADEVLLYKIEDDIVGIVTLASKNDMGEVGIVAVDTKYRGKGIAKQMMFAAEKWFFDNGLKDIQVVTQGNNLPANTLYKKCEYSIDKKKFFYHMWNNKFKNEYTI